MRNIDPIPVAICGVGLLVLYIGLWNGVIVSKATKVQKQVTYQGYLGLYGGLALLAASLVLAVLQS